MPDDEYEALEEAARRRRKPISRLVRESLKRTLGEPDERSADERLAAFLRFARFTGPTGDIHQILAEIERGRAL